MRMTIAVDSTRPAGPLAYRKRFELAVGPDKQKAEHDRLEFWADTCREPTRFHIGTPPIQELYRKHGCLFCEPSPAQVQEVLHALDAAMPAWDRDYPQLFYDTLKVNFPELVRMH